VKKRIFFFFFFFFGSGGGGGGRAKQKQESSLSIHTEMLYVYNIEEERKDSGRIVGWT
jgi:hypothetical protein